MSKEIDPYVKNLIKKVPMVIEDILNTKTRGYSKSYYLGNFQTDVYDNFTNIQAEKIFKKMRKYLGDNRVEFLQKRIHIGVDYFIRRVK